MEMIHTPVLIVGGGGAGLASSVFLGQLGIEHILIERHEGTSHLPKAHYLNQRTMEILRQFGLAELVYAASAPRANHGQIRWLTSLGGDGPFDGLDILSVDIMGGGGLAQAYDEKGTTHPTHIPQLRLEPIIRRYAEANERARLLFGHELTGFTDDGDGVTADVRNLADGTRLQIRADYLIAADAGKTVGPALGVEMIGDRDRGDFFSVWFSADLSRYIDVDDACMRRFYHPDQPFRVGSLLTFGPDDWGRHSREWNANFAKGPNTGELTDEEAVAEALGYLRVDVPVEVHRVSRWSLEAVIADRFTVGRVHLVGDAAHKHPPTAGLGLNSAIQDAHNLTWKIAMVIRGEAGAALLDSFESERRPVVQANANWAMFANQNRPILMTALGAAPAAPDEDASVGFARLLEDTNVGAARRAQLREIFRIQRVEYAAHDLELGFTYASTAVASDGSTPVERDPMGADYRPNTRPGSRLPHAWLERGGRRVSTHDLAGLGHVGLLTGPTGKDWVVAAEDISAAGGVQIDAVTIGPGGDIEDPMRSWESLSQVDEAGMVLVRPDMHVAFRVAGPVDDHRRTLAAALGVVLGTEAPSLSQA